VKVFESNFLIATVVCDAIESERTCIYIFLNDLLFLLIIYLLNTYEYANHIMYKKERLYYMKTI